MEEGQTIRVITKLPDSEQSDKGKVKTKVANGFVSGVPEFT
jgi:hypothetical protein